MVRISLSSGDYDNLEAMEGDLRFCVEWGVVRSNG